MIRRARAPPKRRGLPDGARAAHAGGRDAAQRGARQPTFLRGWLLLARALVQAWPAAEGALAYQRYLREQPVDAEAGAEFETLAARQPVAAAKAPATAPIPDAHAILVAKPKPSASPSPTPSPDAILVAKPSPSAEAPWPVPLVPAPEGCDTIVPQQRQALTRHPTGAPAHEALLACLHQLGQWSQQEAAARAALRDAPELLRAWFFLGEALRMQGKIAEAESAYRKYVAGRAARPDGYLGLAETLRAQGEALDALASYGFYVELEERPDAQAARQRAEQIAKAVRQQEAQAPAAAPWLRRAGSHGRRGPKPPAADRRRLQGRGSGIAPRWRRTDRRAHDGLLACLQREGQYASVGRRARGATRRAHLAIAWFALGGRCALGRPPRPCRRTVATCRSGRRIRRRSASPRPSARGANPRRPPRTAATSRASGAPPPPIA